MAEGEGFEPPKPFGSAVFKTAAIDHSANPPKRGPTFEKANFDVLRHVGTPCRQKA